MEGCCVHCGEEGVLTGAGECVNPLACRDRVAAERNAALRERDQLNETADRAWNRVEWLRVKVDAVLSELEEQKLRADILESAAAKALRERDHAKEGWKDAAQWLKRLVGIESMPNWFKTEPWLFEEDNNAGQ